MTVETPEQSVREATPLTDSEVRERLQPLPPSAKLVAYVLGAASGLSQSELADRSLLPPPTVRYALTRLDDADLVVALPDFEAPRKRIYTLHA